MGIGGHIHVEVVPLLSGSSYRGAITGKSQMGWIHQSVLNRTIQELVAIEPENKGERIFLFQLPTIQQREKPKGEAWKRYWKSHRESYHLSFSLWEVSF